MDPQRVKFDVFISFRGEDTRTNFTSHLHAALIRRKVDMYIDYRLERGDEVGHALFKAIKESKISVVVFSKNYASSAWCLDELTYIMGCRREHGQLVIPIFYNVDPSEVRYQSRDYKTAFAKHEERLKDETNKVGKWKEALVEASNISGFDSSARTVRHDSDLVEQVVTEVLDKLNRGSSVDLSGLIGAEGRIQKILLELDIIPQDDRVRHLVIWGMGGIGKTALADAVFHGLSSQFEAHCFLANVRERSGTRGFFSPELYILRNQLVGELLGDMSLAIHTRTIGSVDKERLRRAKVLVVLDDVNDSSQLTFLAEEVPFGGGSRIIITTRDMRPIHETLLVDQEAHSDDVKIYKVDELNDNESLQLFHSKAPPHFKENSEFVAELVKYAAGIPLALKVLLPLFLRCKSKKELEVLWGKMKKFPDTRLQNVYRASYDGLQRNEREIFLDIACFHKSESLCDVKRILAACGLVPDDGINLLVGMSLVSIKRDCIWMHDVIQEMAWEIVREESTGQRGKRSRLHRDEDVFHVLKTNTGTAEVQSISSRYFTEIPWLGYLGPRAFSGMHNLTFLKLDFRHVEFVDDKANLAYLPDTLRCVFWSGYPFRSLPSQFSPDNLVELHLPRSNLVRLWGKDQNPRNLRRIDLRSSYDLVEVEGLSNSLDIESINLGGCSRLIQIPSYFGKFTKLTHLDLENCSLVSILPKISNKMESLDLSGTEIQELPPSIWRLEKLVRLDLHSCRSIKIFPSSPWKLKSLKYLSLCQTKIRTVTSTSLMSMTAIISLDLSYCDNLVSIPTDICKLKSLEILNLYGCSSFTNFPEIEEPMVHLRHLYLGCTNIAELPSSIGNLVGLTNLSLKNCTRLEYLPNSICSLTLLKWFSLDGCLKLLLPPSFYLSSSTDLNIRCVNELQENPDWITWFPLLQVLNLQKTMIESIPPSIKDVLGLKTLMVTECQLLQSLPVLSRFLEKLDAEGCEQLSDVSASVTAQTQADLNQTGDMTERYTYAGCVSLNERAISNIMDDAYFRIMRIATACNLKHLVSGRSALLCPGNEIPKWFSCQADGSSMIVGLPCDWSDDSNFLGIALCSVCAIQENPLPFEYQCEMTLNTINGETCTVDLNCTQHFRTGYPKTPTDHVFVWYDTVSAVLSDDAKYSMASFDFYTVVDGERLNAVKRCGVLFMYKGEEINDREFHVIPLEEPQHGSVSLDQESEPQPTIVSIDQESLLQEGYPEQLQIGYALLSIFDQPQEGYVPLYQGAQPEQGYQIPLQISSVSFGQKPQQGEAKEKAAALLKRSKTTTKKGSADGV